MAKKLLVLFMATIMLFGVLGLVACENTNLADYKVIGKEKIDAHVTTKVQSDYNTEKWGELLNVAAEGKQAVEDATNKGAVDTAVNDTKTAINTVKKEAEMANIVSIHFFTTENWVHWQDHKYYDFANMNYSTKRILVEFDSGESFVITDAEYEVKSTFTQQQLSVFFDNIRDNNIFGLDKHYHENADDADSWSLTITLSDGTVFESSGYATYPPQKIALDEAFLALTGYKLFTSLSADNQ